MKPRMDANSRALFRMNSLTMTDSQSRPPPEAVWDMFDRIAPRYDLLNRLLSLRRDVAWRRRMACYVPAGTSLRLLDLATGTGDQILHLLDAGASLGPVVGMDMAEGMLAIGREKLAARGLQDRVALQRGDATRIPACDGSFDAVTISFGIRNVGDIQAALRDMRRVLRPGGRALVLEFSLPSAAPLRGLYLFYLRHVLPVVGGWLSGDRQAYRYLNRTIEDFPSGDAFCACMREAGFSNTVAYPQTFGVASIYVGEQTPDAGAGGGGA
jgi:demethylmenaquinone methyltransferase/2-methoxy-6-polyprenyl-1,4-benzoquinol methylase